MARQLENASRIYIYLDVVRSRGENINGLHIKAATSIMRSPRLNLRRSPFRRSYHCTATMQSSVLKAVPYNFLSSQHAACSRSPAEVAEGQGLAKPHLVLVVTEGLDQHPLARFESLKRWSGSWPPSRSKTRQLAFRRRGCPPSRSRPRSSQGGACQRRALPPRRRSRPGHQQE